MSTDPPGFDDALEGLRRLIGKLVEVEVAFVPEREQLTNGFAEGRAVWAIAQFAGRLEKVRRSSRCHERWFVEFESSSGSTSFDLDRSAFDGAVVDAASTTVVQQGISIRCEEIS